MDNKYHITSDGTIFELQSDGTYKKLGKVSETGKVNSCNEHSVKKEDFKTISSHGKIKIDSNTLNYVNIFLTAVSGFLGLLLCARTDSLNMDIRAGRTDYLSERYDELVMCSWLAITSIALTLFCIYKIKHKPVHNNFLYVTLGLAIACILIQVDPVAMLWPTNLLYITFVILAFICQLDLTKDLENRSIANILKIASILEILWAVGMWLFCLQNFGTIPK